MKNAGIEHATVVKVTTGEGVTGYGSGDSGDTMDGFEPYAELFIGTDTDRLEARRH